MSDYLKLNGEPADVIGMATLITAGAESLKADLGGLLGDIERLESASVIGSDEFADSFNKNYRQQVSTGNGSAPATDATKQAASSLADTGSQYGNAVISAMQDYMVTDGQNATSIDSTTST